MTTTYEFRVDGHLDSHWSSWLGSVELIRCPDGTSTLRGPIADQAQLHGVLARLRDIGATLLSVRVVDPSAEDDRALRERLRDLSDAERQVVAELVRDAVTAAISARTEPA